MLLTVTAYLLPDDDMYRGVFFIVFCLLSLIGALFFKKAVQRIACIAWCLIFIVLEIWVVASKYDIYGENTILFDKLKRDFYWLTPNFETSDNATMIADNSFSGCNRLESVKISNSVEKIGNAAFANCKCLKRVEIGNGVASIGENAFYGCSDLIDVEIGCGVALIEKRAFKGCRSLERITIPSHVASIENGAFYDCTSLKDVYCEATTPPVLEDGSVFAYDITGDEAKYLECTIYVPYRSVEAYRTADVWKALADRIKGYDF